MARIRTIKPEALQHRKVGPLSDRTFRLWVALLTQADDDGRLVEDARSLRALVWGYQSRVVVAAVEEALSELATAGLIHRYTAGGQAILEMQDWHDHQRVRGTSHYNPSKWPSYKDSVESTERSVSVPQISRTVPPSRARVSGSDRIGSELPKYSSSTSRRPGGRPIEEVDVSDPIQQEGPEALLALWREIATTTKRPGLPGLIVPDSQLTTKRREGALRRLKEAELAWHHQAISRLSQSAFACGRPKPDGSRWRASFDWYLKSETNCVKAHEGAYDDATES